MNIQKTVPNSHFVIVLLCLVITATFPVAPSAHADSFRWIMTPTNANWDNVDNWGGPFGQFPDDDTDRVTVALPSPFNPVLTADRTVGALTIQSGKDVFTGNGTNNFQLGVRNNGGNSGMTLIEGAGSSLTVYQSPSAEDLDTDDLTIRAGSSLFIEDGATVQVDRSLRINPDGEIRGNGILELNGFNDGINDGAIRADGGTLRVEASGSATLDADGFNGDGILEAIDGDLDIFFSLTEEDFNGIARVGPGRTMRINSFIVGAGGVLSLDGVGSNATYQGLLEIEPGGVLRATGAGVVESVLSISGTVEATNSNSHVHLNNLTGIGGGSIVGAGTVHIAALFVTGDTTVSVDTFDMDGLNGDAILEVWAGNTLRVESPSIESNSDGYDATLEIDNGIVDIVAPWVLEGTVNLNDDDIASPQLIGDGGVTINGGQINFTSGTGFVNTPVIANSGTIYSNAAGTMDAPKTLGAAATIDIENGGSLRLMDQTTMLGPSIVGNGRLILEGEVTVSLLDTTIGTLETDLDGQTGTTEITVNSGVTLGINSNTVEPTANDGFDGTIHNAGTLSVLPNWRLDGVLNMDPVAGTSTLNGVGTFEIFESGVVNASEDVVINPDTIVSGTMNVALGRTQMNGTADFTSTANVNITASGELELNGTTTFNSGDYNGAGTLQWDGPTTIEGLTTMTLGAVDLDGTTGNTVTTVGSPLILNVDQIDTGNNSFDGTLHFNGLIAGMRVNLNDPNDVWRMDGTINASGAGIFTQDILQGSGIDVTGTINADGITQSSAALDVSGSIHTADAATEFRFSNDSHVIRSSAVVDGPGTMVVNSDATLMAEDGSSVEVDVVNRGRFAPGLSIGTAAIAADYTQESNGTFAVELETIGVVDQNDQLTVDGLATLAGELEATALAGFMPSVGTSYTILTADNVVGTFDTLTIHSDSMFSFDADVLYPGTRVVLRISDVTLLGDFSGDVELDCADVDALVAEIASGGANLDFDITEDGVIDINDLNEWLVVAGTFNVGGAYLPGDANLDGVVDGQDFIVWNNNKFTSTAAWCSGDFTADGAVDGQDFFTWNSHKFMSSTAVANVPEPTAWLMLVLGLVAVCRWR